MPRKIFRKSFLQVQACLTFVPKEKITPEQILYNHTGLLMLYSFLSDATHKDALPPSAVKYKMRKVKS